MRLNSKASDEAMKNLIKLTNNRQDISLCPFCNCMTKTIKGKCGKCTAIKNMTSVIANMEAEDLCNVDWWNTREKILRSEKTPNKRLLFVFNECKNQHEKEISILKLDLEEEFGKKLAGCYAEIAEQYMVNLDDVLKIIKKCSASDEENYKELIINQIKALKKKEVKNEH